MKGKSLFLAAATILALFLACCSTQSSPALPSSAESAEATRKLTQGWMDAYQARDAEKFMSYYDEKVVYLNVVIKDFGTVTFDGLSKSIRDDFVKEDSGLEFASFFVSSDGKFASIEGTYYDLNSFGRRVSIPIAIVLEIQDGKIIRQTDYFDGGLMK